MTDLVTALGLTLAIEGILFAAAPGPAKRASRNVVATPDATLRIIGVASAAVGVAIVWTVRG